MNQQRRKVLKKVVSDLMLLKEPETDKDKALSILKSAQSSVETEMDAEEDTLDSLPENLYWSARSDNMRDNISDLSDANTDLEILIDDIPKNENYQYINIKMAISKIIHSINDAIYR